MTPGQAIRAFCVQCVGSHRDVPACGGDKCLNGGCDEHGVCWFHIHRMGRGRPSVRLIRKYCLYCMGDSQQFVRECAENSCPLHYYRMGKNPNMVGRTGKGRPFAKLTAQ